MKDETRKSLDQLLDTYDRRREEAENSAQEQLDEERKFLGAFRVCCDRIIHPAMEEIGEHLRSRGHGYSISSSDELVEVDGRTIPPRITIQFYPAGIDRSEFTSGADTPHVSFVANRSMEQLWIHQCNMAPGIGGSAGSKGEVSLKEINRDFVQEQIVAMVQDVLGKLARSAPY